MTDKVLPDGWRVFVRRPGFARAAKALPAVAGQGGGPVRQRGQVMPMTVVFIVVVLLAMWVLYDTGELASEKIRLQNTADNVAYSTAALVSRDLNFIAYTNRGMIANQVAIAQMVGLSSWAASMEQLATNIDTLASIVPIPGIQAVSAAIRAGAASSAGAIDAAAMLVIPVNDAVVGLLSQAQRAYHMGVVGQIPDFSQDVGFRNDPDAVSLMAAGGYSLAEAASLLTEWRQAVGPQYSLADISDPDPDAVLANRRYRELDAVVNTSRDRFSKNRSYAWGEPFKVRFEALGGRFKVDTDKYGGSDFVRTVDPRDNRYRWDWAGMETVSSYVEFCIGPPMLEKCENFEVPLAWGAAHALHQSHGGTSFFDYGLSSERRQTWRWGEGAWRNRLSAQALVAGVGPVGRGSHTNHRLAAIDGLRPFHEFRSDAPIWRGPAVISLYVKNADRLDSQHSLLRRHGATVAPDQDAHAGGGLIADRAAAVAKAEPYFMRPTDLDGWRRDDRRLEYGSLYNPFWQPRLVDLSDEEKLTANAIVSNGLIAPGGLP